MKKFRKAIAALVGAVTTALALGLLPEEYAPYVATAITFLTALGVYVTPNIAPEEG